MRPSSAVPTMTPEEEAAWPASLLAGQPYEGEPRKRPAPKPVVEGVLCIADYCPEEATETGRCVEHEAHWLREAQR